MDNVVVMNRRVNGLHAVSQRQLALARHRVADASDGERAQVIGYFVRRLVALVPVALGVATLTFALIHLVPGDPVVAMLANRGARGHRGNAPRLGLDRPIAAQYAASCGDSRTAISASRFR